MLVRASGTTSELNAAGAVLGQFPDWVYEQSDVQLSSGDALLLFTDGMVEASDQDVINYRDLVQRSQSTAPLCSIVDSFKDHLQSSEWEAN